MSKDILDVADALDRVQDDKELFLELLDIFQEDYTEKRRQLGQFVAANDLEQTANTAHSLKGAAGNISAAGVNKVCAQIEQLAEDRALTDYQSLLKKLDEQYRLLDEHIKIIKKDFLKG